MMRKLAALVAGLMMLGLPALAQNAPMYQSGPVSPGDLPKWDSKGKVGSAGGVLGDANGKGVNPFSVYDRNGYGQCFRTGPVSGPHNMLCLGHKADGTPIITVQSLGGFPEKSLRCNINGVEGDCFGPGSTPPPPGGGVFTLGLNSGDTLGLNSGADLGLNTQ